jgi:hypothetical protein
MTGAFQKPLIDTQDSKQCETVQWVKENQETETSKGEALYI